MRRRTHLRLPFWVYSGLTALVAVAAMNSGNNLLLWLFAVLASSLLVSGVVSGAMLRSLAVRRMTPGHAAVGEPLLVRYVARNRGRLMPVFNVRFREQPARGPGRWRRLMAPAEAWAMHIGPRERVHAEAVLWPTQRGEARFEEVEISTTFPFGIVRKTVTVPQPQRLLVHPRLYAIRRRVLDAIAPAGALGSRVSSHAGAGDDFYGIREFRPGDSMRQVAWKRTANRDELVCVERTRPSPPRLMVVLNLSRRAGEPEAAARGLEEQAISLVASLVHGADLLGFEVGLTILGVDRSSIPVQRSHWHRNRIMAALAEIDLDVRRVRVAAGAVPRTDRAGLVVVHPDRAEPAVVSGDAWHFTARQLGHLVERAIGWGPGEPGEERGPEAAGAAEAAA